MAFREIEEGRAKFAYKCAEEGSKINQKKEYRSYVKNIPMYIKTNGLAATYAFIASKFGKDKNSAYRIIYDQTRKWLEKDEKGLIKEELKKEEDLVKVLISLDSRKYRAVTLEVLAFFNWLRRFAQELIEEH